MIKRSIPLWKVVRKHRPETRSVDKGLRFPWLPSLAHASGYVSSLRLAVLVSTLSVFASSAHAQSNSKGADSRVVVGTLKSVDSSGTKYDIQLSDESLRKLNVNTDSKIHFIGLPAKDKQKPEAGMGVKATCLKDGRIKTISFTPPVGEPALLGEERTKMTESELLKAVDKDASNSVSYVEFSKYIYYSPKHGPDSYRKFDEDIDGALDSAEFAQALTKVSWWKLSRKTPDQWFTQADKNKDGKLDIKEFASISASGNHIENIFKRTDGDKSGSLTQSETAAYIRSVTHGKKKSRKRDRQNNNAVNR